MLGTQGMMCHSESTQVPRNCGARTTQEKGTVVLRAQEPGAVVLSTQKKGTVRLGAQEPRAVVLGTQEPGALILGTQEPVVLFTQEPGTSGVIIIYNFI